MTRKKYQVWTETQGQEDTVLCVGGKAKCYSYYKKNGGARAGLHVGYVIPDEPPAAPVTSALDNPAIVKLREALTLAPDETEKLAHILFNTIAELAAKYYKPECRDDVSTLHRLGDTLAKIGYDGRQVAELAYAAWEDMNAHSFNVWHEWAWRLSDSPFDLRELGVLQRIGNRTVQVNERWNQTTLEYDRARYRITVNFEKVEA